MKYLYKTFIAVTLIFFSFACEEKIDELGQNDPDAATTANDSDLLTSGLGYAAIVQDVDFNDGPSAMWAQYKTWGIGVSIGNAERFQAEADDENGTWRRTFSDCLADFKRLAASENNAYKGVAKIMTAFMYQVVVDHWGDVPYTQALNGEIADGGILTPEFDDAAAIYAALVISIDEALADLDVADNVGDVIVGPDDLFFAGVLDQWRKFGNSLKLRILMRTSETDPQGTAITDLISTGTFLETTGDVVQLAWSGVTGNENPLYATQLSGVGDFYFATDAMVGTMTALGDPRLPFMYAAATTGANAGTIVSICQGCVDRDVPFTAPDTDYSGSSAFTNGPAVPTVMMSPWEVWFLRAEAAARYGTADDEATAYANAIQVNFDYIGVAGGAAYIASLGYDPTASLDNRIDRIAVQKWISLNGTQEDEGWIETRRFDRPASRLFTDASTGIFDYPPLSALPGTFPSSYLYPSTEISFNPNAPAQRALTDRIFWDD